MIKIGIIIGSIRPGRVGESVSRWVLQSSIGTDLPHWMQTNSEIFGTKNMKTSSTSCRS